MLGFCRIPRGTRPNYLPYLERYFSVSGESAIEAAHQHFISNKVHVPRGMPYPSPYEEVLESSPSYNNIGKLKMALELR